jgi:23S rRNA (uridine2552-2'-O)-methyltransferase
LARYNPKDRFHAKARAEGFRARSAFKLEEILEKLGSRALQGQSVIDLGAWPGGWLQVLAREGGPKGMVIGLDLVEIAGLGPNVRTHVVDVRDKAAMAQLGLPAHVALVTSDMAPKTTGIHGTDVARSHELVRMAIDVARDHLSAGGAFVAKVFMGEGLKELELELKGLFEEVRQVRPEATREGSREIYLVAKRRKAPARVA